MTDEQKLEQEAKEAFEAERKENELESQRTWKKHLEVEEIQRVKVIDRKGLSSIDVSSEMKYHLDKLCALSDEEKNKHLRNIKIHADGEGEVFINIGDCAKVEVDMIISECSRLVKGMVHTWKEEREVKLMIRDMIEDSKDW